MARYDYRCFKCGKIFELVTKKMETEEERKPRCTNCDNDDKESLEFIVAETPFQLKGGGWFSESASSKVDPTSVSGVSRVENPSEYDGVLHKKKKKKLW